MAPKAAAKKAPKAKVKAKAKALERAPSREKMLDAPDVDGDKKLNDMIEEMFKCYDEDEDGMMERVEYLDMEEKWRNKADENFGPKERKAAFNWFKEAGAEGTPTDGMFLSLDKYKEAYIKMATEKSEIPVKESTKLAEWIWETHAKLVVECAYKAPPAGSAAGAAGAAPGAPGAKQEPPEYPMTIPLQELEIRCTEARAVGRNVLILSSGLEQVETFLSYKTNSALDAKQILGELFIKKSKSKEECQDMAEDKLRWGLGKSESGGFAKPLWIRMANCAFDWVGFCDEKKFPAEVFSSSLWTIDKALALGLIDEAQKFNLEVEDEKKWKDFQVQITSTFDLESANKFLFDKIPFYDELAILQIDPASIA